MVLFRGGNIYSFMQVWIQGVLRLLGALLGEGCMCLVCAGAALGCHVHCYDRECITKYITKIKGGGPREWNAVLCYLPQWHQKF